MKKSNTFIKLLIVFGTILTLVGGIIFSVAMTISKWDFSVLASSVYQRKVIEIVEQEELDAISSVKIVFSTTDVKIDYHDEQKITVEGFDLCNRKGEVIEELATSTSNGELAISFKKQKTAIISMGTAGKDVLTLKIPRNKVVKLSVTLSTGSVEIGESGKDYNFSEIDLKTATGDVNLTGNLNCKVLNITNSTGDTFVKGNLKVQSFTRKATTGNLVINAKIEANTIDVKNSTGDVKSSAYITANSINVKTSTGDVTLKLLGSKSDYSYTYDISTGKSNIMPMVNAGQTKTVKITISTGDAYIYFER